MIFFVLSMISTYQEPITGIDNPLPVLLYHGEVIIHIKEEPIKGAATDKLRAKICVGIWNGIILGTSFGGTNIVGYGDTDWESRPAIDLRIRLFGNGMIESVLGYNDEPVENYAKKYLFANLGTRLLPGLMISGGINYNYEEEIRGADLFGNAFLNLNETNTLQLEYILGANDEDKNRINLAYKLQSGSLGIQFDLKNIFSGNVGRQFQIFYRESF